MFGSALVGLLTIVGMRSLTQNLGWVATISCDKPGLCVGTNGDDVIRDGDDGQIIDGLPGDDTINSGGGDDDVCGGPGNDIITHGFGWDTESDGVKDFLDCGPGDDIALLNITVDHDDAAANCEHINPYP